MRAITFKIFFCVSFLSFPVSGCLGTAEEERFIRIEFVGNQSNDLLGRSVTSVGKVNWNSNGNVTDILIGAPSFDDGQEFSDKGAAYLIFGKRNPPKAFFPGSSDPEAPAPNVTFLGSQAGGNLGFSVAGVGDVNGDGFDDFLIGAPLVRDPNNPDPNQNGAAYLVFGGTPLRNKLQACEQEPRCLTDSRMRVLTSEVGEKRYTVIVSEETVEDPDITFPDPNDPNIPPADITISNPLYKLAFVLRAGSSQSNFGFSLSGVGDVNGDGCPDFLIGAPFNGADRSGAAYLYRGSGACNGGADLLSTTVTPKVPPLSPSDSFIGEAVNEHLGLSVSGLGDMSSPTVQNANDPNVGNPDGFADFLIGAPTEVPRTGFAGDFQISTLGCGGIGHAYLFLGRANIGNLTASDADVVFNGSEDKDCFGLSVAGVGDGNGDGRPDLMIGAPVNDGGGANNDDQGAAFYFYGRNEFRKIGSDTDSDPSTFEVFTQKSFSAIQADATFQGSSPRQFLGGSLAGNAMPWTGIQGASGLWDWNGDGLPDFLVGATNASEGAGIRNGAVYLFYGSLSLSGIIKSSDAPKVYAGATRLENFGVSVGLAGDFNNDQKPDFLIGSPLNDNNSFTDNGIAILQIF